VERLERAAEAYNRGDVEPLVALLDEAVDWHGRTRGHLWWKHRLRCHGPEEARANFELRLRKAALRPGYAGVRLDDVREEGDRIMVGATWETDEGKLSELPSSSSRSSPSATARSSTSRAARAAETHSGVSPSTKNRLDERRLRGSFHNNPLVG
jgi:hypothetical protein